MLLNAKKLAFLGLLLSFDVILVILGSILEMNTLFLLAMASFCVGIAIREGGKNIGFSFFVASILISLILAPNKLYCITYSGMGFYLLLTEFFYDRLSRIKRYKDRSKVFWLIKYAAFNMMYVPILIFLPKLIYQGKLDPWIMVLLFLAGQPVLFLYDLAYEYFQRNIWNKVRRHWKFW